MILFSGLLGLRLVALSLDLFTALDGVLLAKVLHGACLTAADIAPRTPETFAAR